MLGIRCAGGVLLQAGLDLAGNPLLDGRHQFLAGDGDDHVVEGRALRAGNVAAVVAIAILAIEIVRHVAGWPRLAADGCPWRNDDGGDVSHAVQRQGQRTVAVDRLGAVVIAQFRCQRVPQARAGIVGQFGEVERHPG